MLNKCPKYMYILSDAATKLNFHCRLSVKEMLKPDEEETLLKKTIKKAAVSLLTYDSVADVPES